MQKNVAGQKIGAQLVSATDGSAFTGSVTVYVTGDGGTQAAGSVGSGACTHEGNGFHTYAPAQAETNYDHVAFTFTGTGAVPVTVQVYTTYPQTGDSYARLGAPAGADIATDIAGVQTDTNDIQTRLPAALVSGRIDASVGAYQSGLTPLQPTTAGRTLDVTATGAAGIDWGNVENATSSVALTGTTIATTQQVDVNTIKTQAVTCAAGVTVSPYVGSTGAAVNGSNVNTLAGHDPGATLGTSTLTQAQVTGGAYALNSASFAFNSVLDLTTAQKASVNAEADTALADFAPPTYTELLNMIRLLLRSDSAVATDLSALLTAINADLGSGAGNYVSTTDSQQALRDRGDSAWITATSVTVSDKTGFSLASGGLAAVTAWTVDITGDVTGNLSGSVGSISGVSFPTNFGDLAITATTGRVTVGTNADKTGYSISGTKTTLDDLNDVSTADINTQAAAALATYDPPTNVEMVAAFTEIKGATWSSATDTLEALRDRGDAAWVTATGFSTLDAAGVRTAVGLATANLDTQLGTLSTNVGSVLTDTGTTIPNQISALSIPTAVQIRQEIDSNSTQLAAILTDTGTTIPNQISALNNLSTSDVKTQVVAALNTDTYAEPTGAPAATATLTTKLGHLYKALRNKITVTAGAKTFFNDDGSSAWSKSLSDDGTTYTESEGS